MARSNALVWGFAIVLAAILVVGMVVSQEPKTAQGSVDSEAGGYYSTTTRRMPDGGTLTNLRVLKTGSGILGSVVVTGANTGVITIYDGTSTVTNIAWPTTTIATLPASTAAGTYTFDVQFSKGIIYEIAGSGLTPTTTITWK